MKSGYYSPIPDTEATETKVEEPTVAMWVAHIISLKRWTASNILCLQTHFLSQVSKVGNQKIPGVTGKFSLRIQNEAEKRLTEFCQENALVIRKYPLSTTQEITINVHITRWSILK